MFNGNFYGVIITILTLMTAVVMASREVRDSGIRFELTIQPVHSVKPERGGEARREQPKAERPAAGPRTGTILERAGS